MSNARKPKAKSLFEQARNAKPRVESYHIPLVDHDEGERLWTDLSDARARLKQARSRLVDEKYVSEASARVAEAEEAFSPAFRTVKFRGLSPKDIDALANEFPDPEGEPPDDHVDFVYRLAVACAVEDYGVTAEEWQELCRDVWPAAEGIAFRRAVLDANQQAYSEGLGKG